MPCAADSCQQPHYARGWCCKHYQRVRRYGTPDGRPVAAPPAPHPGLALADGTAASTLPVRAGWEGVAARLLAHLEPGPEGCWLWLGTLNRTGYGRQAPRRSEPPQSHLAHRALYAALIADPDPRLHLDHLCRRRNCCNPEHLDEVPARVNLRRGLGPIAAKSRQRQCRHGHPFTPDNTLIRKNGTRMCRQCNALRQRATKARRLARLAVDHAADAACPPGAGLLLEQPGRR